MARYGLDSVISARAVPPDAVRSGAYPATPNRCCTCIRGPDGRHGGLLFLTEEALARHVEVPVGTAAHTDTAPARSGSAPPGDGWDRTHLPRPPRLIAAACRPA